APDRRGPRSLAARYHDNLRAIGPRPGNHQLTTFDAAYVWRREVGDRERLVASARRHAHVPVVQGLLQTGRGETPVHVCAVLGNWKDRDTALDGRSGRQVVSRRKRLA